MRNLTHCNKAEIYDDNEQLLCTAAVELDSLGAIMLTAPAEFEYSAQPNYSVTFYDPISGLLTCRCSLSSPLTLEEGGRSFRCDILKNISQVDRRMDLKVPISASTKIKVLRLPGEGADDPKDGFPASYVNISAGGVYLQTKVLLSRGQLFTFNFEEGDEPIPLKAEVLRVDDLSKSATRVMYGYGCRFVNLHRRYESILRGFVFQREKILHEKK